MRILHISQFDWSGGAERIAWNLHQASRQRNHQSQMLVGWKRSESLDVTSLVPQKGDGISYLLYRALCYFERRYGLQAVGYWMAGNWWRRNNVPWDIVHMHNLHGRYFDLGLIPAIARKAHLVITLHDCWLFTGHCAHVMSCERWKSGCGRCPDLITYPGIDHDSTYLNWSLKYHLLKESNPVIVTPSKWLARMVADSPILRRSRCFVIYNGVDTEQFRPGDRHYARYKLGLPVDKVLLLYIANGGLNSTWHKDPALLLRAMQKMVADGAAEKLHLIVVGGTATLPPDLQLHVTQISRMNEGLETLYQAADVAVYPTKVDNCPLVPLEAMSCGLPVISTNVGGVPELVTKDTGFLVAPGDVEGFVSAVQLCYESHVRNQLGYNARKRVEQRFSASQMVNGYFNLWDELANES